MIKKLFFVVFGFLVVVGLGSGVVLGQSKLDEQSTTGELNIETDNVGDYAFIADGSYFRVVDVSNPSNIDILVNQSLNSGGSASSVEWFTYDGNDYVLVSDRTETIELWNVNNLNSPSYIDDTTTDSSCRAWDIDYNTNSVGDAGDVAVVSACRDSSGSSLGMHKIDFSETGLQVFTTPNTWGIFAQGDEFNRVEWNSVNNLIAGTTGGNLWGYRVNPNNSTEITGGGSRVFNYNVDNADIWGIDWSSNLGNSTGFGVFGVTGSYGEINVLGHNSVSGVYSIDSITSVSGQEGLVWDTDNNFIATSSDINGLSIIDVSDKSSISLETSFSNFERSNLVRGVADIGGSSGNVIVGSAGGGVGALATYGSFDYQDVVLNSITLDLPNSVEVTEKKNVSVLASYSNGSTLEVNSSSSYSDFGGVGDVNIVLESDGYYDVLGNYTGGFVGGTVADVQATFNGKSDIDSITVFERALSADLSLNKSVIEISESTNYSVLINSTVNNDLVGDIEHYQNTSATVNSNNSLVFIDTSNRNITGLVGGYSLINGSWSSYVGGSVVYDTETVKVLPAFVDINLVIEDNKPPRSYNFGPSYNYSVSGTRSNGSTSDISDLGGLNVSSSNVSIVTVIEPNNEYIPVGFGDVVITANYTNATNRYITDKETVNVSPLIRWQDFSALDSGKIPILMFSDIVIVLLFVLTIIGGVVGKFDSIFGVLSILGGGLVLFLLEYIPLYVVVAGFVFAGAIGWFKYTN